MITGGLITFLPAQANDLLPWWIVENGVIMARGVAHLQNDDLAFPVATTERRVMALVAPSNCVVRMIDMGDLAPRQAEAAACLKVADESLGIASALHAVAVDMADKGVLAASISAELMQYGLDILAGYGLNPDIVMPCGLVLPQPESGIVRADFGGASAVLRKADFILPDEPGLRAALASSQDIKEIEGEAFDACLIDAFAAPVLNLRSKAFAKKKQGGTITSRQWRILGWMIFTGLLLSLMLALATYWRYDNAAEREDALALSAVRKIAPQASSIADAQSALDGELARKGISVRQFTAPASALYAEVQAAEGLSLRDMRYSANGILAATLAAPTVEPINRVLAVLQEQGYKVTAIPRQDASGLAMADISMRVP